MATCREGLEEIPQGADLLFFLHLCGKQEEEEEEELEKEDAVKEGQK